ncbi:MAG: hypothetical protein HC897_18525 [Thermoanaerobaculia bacterium]|nr:hypothetical protein [Thermoanaerobaculia bacterium]
MKIERRYLMAVLVFFTLLVAAIGGGAVLAQEATAEDPGAQEAGIGKQPSADSTSSEKSKTDDGRSNKKDEQDECDPKAVPPRWPESFRPRDVLNMLWSLGEDECRLARATLVSVAFLVALLTVIAAWEVPLTPGQQRQLAPSVRSDEPASARKEGEPAVASGTKTGPAIVVAFQNNFGRTVLSGLGGLVAVVFIEDSFWKDAEINASAFYVVLYVVFFTSLLIVFALAQGVIEAARSRVATSYYWHAQGSRRKGKGCKEIVAYWLRRAWGWALSWQSTGLVFLEASLNAVQGRTGQGSGFHQAIVDLHRSQLWSAEKIRHEVDVAILGALKRKRLETGFKNLPEPQDSNVRTSISIHNGVRQSMCYIAWERGSMWKEFPKKSIAWFVAASGMARWFKGGEQAAGTDLSKSTYSKAVLREKGDPLPHGCQEDQSFKVADWFASRPPLDYQAFMMIPIPWSRRDHGGRYRNAALHISFTLSEYMDALWEGLEVAGSENEPKQPNYKEWKGILELEKERPDSKLYIRDPQLRAVLHQAVETLGEMLRSFNPRIFEEDILPHMIH